MRHTTVQSPVGPLLLLCSRAGLTGLYLTPHQGWTGPPAGSLEDAAAFTEVGAQLDAYWAGERQHFELPLDLRGSAFQRAVWAELIRIPYGSTRSYGAVAMALAVPGAARAVGLANGRNPVSIVVPCHRVVGADGSLTGYGGGLPNKRLLLAHEAGHAQPSELLLF